MDTLIPNWVGTLIVALTTAVGAYLASNSQVTWIGLGLAVVVAGINWYTTHNAKQNATLDNAA